MRCILTDEGIDWNNMANIRTIADGWSGVEGVLPIVVDYLTAIGTFWIRNVSSSNYTDTAVRV